MSVPGYVGCDCMITQDIAVTSREGRVSRNADPAKFIYGLERHVPRGTCE